MTAALIACSPKHSHNEAVALNTCNQWLEREAGKTFTPIPVESEIRTKDDAITISWFIKSEMGHGPARCSTNTAGNQVIDIDINGLDADFRESEKHG